MKSIGLTKKIIMLCLVLAIGFGAMADEKKSGKEIKATIQLILISGNTTVPVESWMADVDYLESESAPVECWMFDANYLSGPRIPVEPWMSDLTYIN